MINQIGLCICSKKKSGVKSEGNFCHFNPVFQQISWIDKYKHFKCFKLTGKRPFEALEIKPLGGS